jgi:soluble lytic murein transglycosylase
MRLMRSSILLLSCMVIGWALDPLWLVPAPRPAVESVLVVRHPDFQRIEAVLVQRAPGWGSELRGQVAQAIAEESENAQVDPLLVVAIIEVESEFQEHATSVVGAAGLMQVRPTTLSWVSSREGVRLTQSEIENDPSLNVRLGVRYLKYLRELFLGKLDLALMAYNAGPNRLMAGLREGNTEAWQNYVRKVRTHYAALKHAHGESGDWALATRQTKASTQ